MSTDDTNLEAYYAANRVKDEVEDQLLRIPGVNGISVGPKITNGQPTGALAITVHLSEKKPLHELAPDEVVPPEIEGIKTDVLQSGPFQVLSNGTEGLLSDEDWGEYRPLRGGVPVRGSGLPGTMGCIVVASAPDQRAFLLTK